MPLLGWESLYWNITLAKETGWHSALIYFPLLKRSRDDELESARAGEARGKGAGVRENVKAGTGKLGVKRTQPEAESGALGTVPRSAPQRAASSEMPPQPGKRGTGRSKRGTRYEMNLPPSPRSAALCGFSALKDNSKASVS